VPIYYLFKKKHVLKIRQYQLLGILFLVSAVADIVGYILIKGQISNHIVNNIYFLVSFVILSLMYAQPLSDARPSIYSFIGVAFCLFVWETFGLQTVVGAQSYVATFSAILSIGYSIVYYDHLFSTMPAINIMRAPFFWINTAVTYYFGLNLFLFIFSTYIFENLKDEEILCIWIFHNLNNIIRNILYATGLSCIENKHNQPIPTAHA
jgi:hypothetical protein